MSPRFLMSALRWLLAMLLALSAGGALAQSEQQKLVNAADTTFLNFMRDPQMTWLQQNIGRAKGVLIAPEVVKAGFIFGGSGGRAVLVVRDAKSGKWVGPAFYTLATASVGFQAGVAVSEMLTLVMTEEELYTHGRKAHLAGWQIGTHANGDVAIDTTMRVYERLQKESPRRDPRFRLEHCTVVNDSLIARIKALGAIPTPFSTYVYYHGEKMRYYGDERLNHMFALRSFLDAGIRATQASDYPPGEFIPMMALQSEVTRTDMKGNVWGPMQRITVEEAIRVGTINGAYASYEENIKGSIEVGKLADLVVLGRDPLKENPSTLVTIPVERTMAGGRWTFES